MISEVEYISIEICISVNSCTYEAGTYVEKGTYIPFQAFSVKNTLCSRARKDLWLTAFIKLAPCKNEEEM